MRYRQQLNVPFSYDVVFTRNLFSLENDALAETIKGNGPAKAAFFVDQGVLNRQPNLITDIQNWCERYKTQIQLVGTPMAVPGGEEVKNDLTFVQKMTHQFQRFELCRHSYVIAVGGGAVLDAVGLAAAVFHRGIRLIRVPTTVLAQDDSGVGVKNGINLDGVKNLIGTFVPPYAVLNDLQFLTTLDQRDWIGGLSEIVKVAVIKDKRLLNELERLADKLVNRDLDAMETVVRRSAVLHLEHIRTGGEPFEFGSSRPLDFGHWSAHKLEALSNFELRHGEAVAVGIALDLFCAAEAGLITRAERDHVCDIMISCGLVLWHDALQKRSKISGKLSIVAGLEEFRQHLGGELTLSLPNRLGNKIEVHELAEESIENGVKWLEEKFKAPNKTFREITQAK